jgi:hypothetical protein
MRWVALLALAIAGRAAAAYELNGVALGGDEQQVKRAFPSAYCKPLEWPSSAADRRCDDGKISVGGLPARVTVYLKKGAVQGVAVRFDSKDRDRIIGYLKSRWGPPASETAETIAKKGKADRKIFKVNWEKGGERALLVAQSDHKRAQLDVWRGNFYDEIYKVR